MSDIRLDETTYYSVLGVSPNATETEIRKSYMKLARKLHPDKSKSVESEEMFKIIVHAHSILTDSLERERYDRNLLINNLHTYAPKQNHDDPRSPSKQKSQKSRNAYDQQPYGFGTEVNNKKTKSEVPIFQSFNLKSYQRSQKYSKNQHLKKDKQETKSRSGGDFVQDTLNSMKEENSRSSASNSFDENIKPREEYKPTSKNAPKEERNQDFDPGEPIVDGHATSSKRTEFEENNDEENVEVNIRTKLHKVNLDNSPSKTDSILNHEFRHYARTKFEQSRRSTSPLKNYRPGSSTVNVTEDWNTNLKDIIERIGKLDKNESTSKNEATKFTNFDMSNIQDTLEDAISSPPPHKRHRKSGDSWLGSQEESLHNPVNYTLPRYYKSEEISKEKLMINENILEFDLPEIPDFGLKQLNRMEIQYYREETMKFISKCQFLKKHILSYLLERNLADTQYISKLAKSENFDNWLSGTKTDLELMNKLHELQYRQSIVIQTFTAITRSIYEEAKY